MDFTQRAGRLWWLAIVTGIIGGFLGVLWVSSSQGPGLDWVWALAAFGVGVMVYSIAFFALCSIFLPGLSKLVEDDTEVDGDDVTHIVRHVETGHEKFDFYIRAYAAARGVSATTIVAGVMIAIALWFF